MRRIDIGNAHSTEFLPAQRGIISQREHYASAQRLAFDNLHNRLPLLFSGYPGQSMKTRDQAALMRPDE
jgi:hypothetical protein